MTATFNKTPDSCATEKVKETPSLHKKMVKRVEKQTDDQLLKHEYIRITHGQRPNDEEEEDTPAVDKKIEKNDDCASDYLDSWDEK